MTTPTQPTIKIAATPSDGSVIDPPVTPEEASLVDSMLEHFDAPSSDDLLFNNIDEISEAPPQEEALEAPETVVAAPEAAAVTPAPVEPAPPVVAAPVVAPVAAEPVTPVVGQPTQAVAPGQELSQLRAAMEAQRETFISQAAQSYTDTFTEEDIQEFQEAPSKALGKMAARLHADVAQNILGLVSSTLPAMILSVTQARTAHQQQQDVFFTENPDLKEHEATVMTMAQLLRAQNPQMPADQFKPLLAAATRAAKGLATTPPAPAKKPATIKAPAFQPAAPSGRAPQAATDANSGNPWAQMSEIIEADDRGAFDR